MFWSPPGARPGPCSKEAAITNRSARSIGFVWDNFGPVHHDECAAVASAMPNVRIVGIELYASSKVYAWKAQEATKFTKVTLCAADEGDRIGNLALAMRIVRACRRYKLDTVFLCHYQRPAIFFAVVMLRLLGRRLFVMSDSKFDDYPRYMWRELGKRLMFMPYHGAMVASDRTADYLRFLGVPYTRMAFGYDTISVERIRAAARLSEPIEFGARVFLCVARLVPKKNHKTLLQAYALYRAVCARPRALVLCGSGPLEAELRAQAEGLGLADSVQFRGNLTSQEVSQALARSLCLLLPSVEEQFGIVVLEALAVGIPVIVSENCGSRDRHVRSGVNGFLVESNNAEGLARYLALLGSDEAMWKRMAEATREFAPLGDASRFAQGVMELIACRSDRPAE